MGVLTGELGALYAAETGGSPADLREPLGATPAAVLTAAFGTWMGERCGTRDLVLASSSASRTRPEHSLVVGPVGEAFEYSTDLFDHHSVRRWGDEFVATVVDVCSKSRMRDGGPG